MEFIVNDCSLHGQFHAPTVFVESLRRLFELRNRLERSNRIVRSPRGLLEVTVGPNLTFRQAFNSIADQNLRRALAAWLGNKGPFWDDENERLHKPDDWFEVKNEIVTDTGVGEAAMATLRGLQRALLSFDPSKWTYTPVNVEHVRAQVTRQQVTLENHWSLATIEQCLWTTRPPLASWGDLVLWAKQECPRLILTGDVIDSLEGYPFIPGAADRFKVLLSTLDKIKGSFDSSGALTEEGMRIYQAHFAGDKAWFTDSSASEKSEFEQELKFPDPEKEGAYRSCPWHGKVKIEQMRMHFTFPIRHDRPVYIVYIGPKLTKR